LAVLGHIAKFLCFWSISSSIVVVFEAFLKDFGSLSRLDIFSCVFVGVFLNFWSFLVNLGFLLKFLRFFGLTCTNPRVISPHMTGDAALGRPLVFF